MLRAIPVLLLAGCAAEPELTYYADIQPVMQRSCGACHSAEPTSGIDLSTPELASAWAPAIAASVSKGEMPPWKASSDCNEYKGDFSLSDDEIAAIVAWADDGAPLGDPEASVTADPILADSLDRVDLTVALPEPYYPKGTAESPDDYRCFLMEWPADESVSVVGYEVFPDNLNVVHHVIPFVIPAGDAQTYRDLDAADPAPGYSCYGGPSGEALSLMDATWLGAWAPGSGALYTPNGTGIQVDPGSIVVLQMHYFGGAGAEADQTAVGLKLGDGREDWAQLQPWTNPQWVLGFGMEIPAKSESVQHEWTYDVQAGPFEISTGTLHMHELGKWARFEVEHADGSKTCIAEVNDYDFNWQRTYELKKPVTVGPGDKVRISCEWDNPNDYDVSWGDGTQDEMCLAITTLSASR